MNSCESGTEQGGLKSRARRVRVHLSTRTVCTIAPNRWQDSKIQRIKECRYRGEESGVAREHTEGTSSRMNQRQAKGKRRVGDIQRVTGEWLP
jgi:hypothetical protein